MVRQRNPRQEDRVHLAFVREQPCCIPGCPRKAEAAHIRMACPSIDKRETGGGEKPSDQYSVPLCGYHHRYGRLAQHKMNERAFWKMHRINPFVLARRLFAASGGAARALEPKPVKAPRAIKPRDRTAPKRRMSGRALQSRSSFSKGRKLQGGGSFQKRRA